MSTKPGDQARAETIRILAAMQEAADGWDAIAVDLRDEEEPDAD